MEQCQFGRKKSFSYYFIFGFVVKCRRLQLARTFYKMKVQVLCKNILFPESKQDENDNVL